MSFPPLYWQCVLQTLLLAWFPQELLFPHPHPWLLWKGCYSVVFNTQFITEKSNSEVSQVNLFTVRNPSKRWLTEKPKIDGQSNSKDTIFFPNISIQLFFFLSWVTTRCICEENPGNHKVFYSGMFLHRNRSSLKAWKPLPVSSVLCSSNNFTAVSAA